MYSYVENIVDRKLHSLYVFVNQYEEKNKCDD